MVTQAVDVTVIVGPASGHLYAGYDTGQRWNGTPVIAFTRAQLEALIAHGDGTDSNGYGLIYDVQGGFTDAFSDTEAETVPPQTILDLEGDPITVYVPAGRNWELSTEAGPSLYNGDLECTACGSHLANSHQPTCPTTEAQTQHADPLQQWHTPPGPAASTAVEFGQ